MKKGPKGGGIQNRYKRVFKALSLVSVFFVYTTIVIGGYVSSARAGLACPDWPECPPLTTWDIVIEFTHRIWSAVTGLLILGTMILAVFYKGAKDIKVTSVLTLVTLVVQVMIGMFVIRTQLNAEVVTAHLGLATLVFGLSLITAMKASRL